MKKSRFFGKIIRILKEADGGRKVVDICREHGVSQVTYLPVEGQVCRHGGLDAQGT
jgi:hypothetical protein